MWVSKQVIMHGHGCIKTLWEKATGRRQDRNVTEHASVKCEPKSKITPVWKQSKSKLQKSLVSILLWWELNIPKSSAEAACSVDEVEQWLKSCGIIKKDR